MGGWYRGTIFARLIRRIKVGQPHECWPWLGGLRSNGYGTFAVKRNGKWTQTTAHRALYEECLGSIPDGWEIDHVVCQNRACMNIEHLEAVPLTENRKRRDEHRTHCRNGHAYDEPGNTVIEFYKGRGRRRCLACRMMRKEQKLEEKKRANSRKEYHHVKEPSKQSSS